MLRDVACNAPTQDKMQNYKTRPPREENMYALEGPKLKRIGYGTTRVVTSKRFSFGDLIDVLELDYASTLAYLFPEVH